MSRRRVLAGAAWTAPAVVLVTAVPAAASASNMATDLRILNGTTRTAPATDPAVDGSFFNLDFQDFVIQVPGPLVAGQLMLIATFVPDQPGEDRLYVVDDPSAGTPPGWTISPAAGMDATTVTMAYALATSGPMNVSLPDNPYVGTYDEASAQTGTFVLTAMADGYESAMTEFATGPAPAGRARHAGAPRHR